MMKNLLVTWKKIANKYNILWKDSFLCWDLPTNISADFSLTIALSIAGQTKQNPHEVAKEIIKLTDCSGLKWDITNSGYINFSLPISYYQKFLTEVWKKEGQNLRSQKKNVRINIEYVSTNPTGYLHLAHFRQAVIGNVLANIYQFLGYRVTREYYINDRGEQIASLVNSVYCFYQKFQNSSFDQSLNDIVYPGKSTQDAARFLINKWGNKFLYQPLDCKMFDLWKKEILKLILAKINQDLEKCEIKFDTWFSETSLYEKNKHLELLTELKEKDLIYSQEGATFFRSSLGGDDKDRVIIKQTGDYTYFFSDILYHQDKLKRADTLINIWGADHHGFIPRLKSACQLLGYNQKRIKIILVQTLSFLAPSGQSEKFSKRLGNTIELDEALNYLDLNQLKFFLLEKEFNQPLTINSKLLKEKQEKTRLYYFQYAYVRCHQLFQKAREKKIEKISSDINLLKNKKEKKILNLLVRFPFVLEKIIEENKPHYLIYYLDELAHAWQIYYQNSVILEPKNSELTSQKLLLVKNVQIILKLGFDLIGIEALTKM